MFGLVMTTEWVKTLRSPLIQRPIALGYAATPRDAENFSRLNRGTTAEPHLIRYQTLGAVLAVMPWNFSFWQVLSSPRRRLDGRQRRLRLKHRFDCSALVRFLIEDLFRRRVFLLGVSRTLLIGPEQVDRVLGDPV